MTIVTYASYTYDHPNFLVRFPHRRRMEILCGLITRRPITRWLDYGTGDGEVYRYHAEKHDPVEAVLYEPEAIIAEARANLGRETPHKLVTRPQDIEGTFDLITALEVLEHLPLPERVRFFQVAARHLTPGGRMIIEVPVEYGPVLLLKEMGRRLLKGRSSEYETGELLAASIRGRIKDVQDRYNPADARTSIGPHHGFDIGRFEREIGRLGTVIAKHNSPLPLLPAWLNQCRIYEFSLECRDPDAIAAALGLRP
jgi:SAM-dependent methyltransferase